MIQQHDGPLIANRTTRPIFVAQGFLCLVVIIDWASRAVLAWRLSNTMDTSFCVSALEQALARFGRSEILNTDRAASSPAPPSLARWPPVASGSRSTAASAGWTTCASSGCGARTNTRTSISRPIRMAARPRPDSPDGSTFT
ncbi:DDE-type integrase/transposase/recombinase [Bradyrhizobium brasilense]|uniref:DDE-type integrase/transposase/recombinase n=1 Tax=Bradyrhizobium brasilense TaxID=1419277 RepID=UPI003D3179D9|nr:transposase family protein [Bradyrhizobium brasilense]